MEEAPWPEPELPRALTCPQCLQGFKSVLAPGSPCISHSELLRRLRPSLRAPQPSTGADRFLRQPGGSPLTPAHCVLAFAGGTELARHVLDRQAGRAFLGVGEVTGAPQNLVSFAKSRGWGLTAYWLWTLSQGPAFLGLRFLIPEKGDVLSPATLARVRQDRPFSLPQPLFLSWDQSPSHCGTQLPSLSGGVELPFPCTE